MKKVILSLLAVVLLTACGDKNSYQIKGTANGVADGTEVYLFGDRRGRSTLETSKVQNGEFTFSARKITKEEDVIYFGTEVLEDAGSVSRPAPVFVESGEVIISMDNENIQQISGTPLNKKQSEIIASFDEKEAPDTEQITDIIKANADNALGVYYFERMLYMYGVNEAKEILALFPPKFEDNRSLQLVRNYIKMSEETAVGAPFKDLKGLSPDSAELALSDYVGKNKVVLVDFWASWCPPCRKDMPLLVEAYAKYKDKGFEIVGVSLDKTNKDWIKGIEDLNITWPQMSDLKYWESDLSKAYAVRSIPTTILIDEQGNIIARSIKAEDLDAKLSELLNK